MLLYFRNLFVVTGIGTIFCYGAKQASAQFYAAQQKVIPPVLMYHEVRDLTTERQQGTVRPLESSDVTVEAFREQMNDLTQRFQSISSHELYDYLVNDKPLPRHPVLITLDDGYLGNYTNALPVLDRSQLKATFFVHTSYVGTLKGNPTMPTSYDHMSWDELRTIALDSRYEVQSHTLTHPRLTDIDAAQLDKELGRSRHEVEENIGIQAPFLAYPFGAHDSRVIANAKKYYAMAFIVSRATQNISGIYQVPRLIVGKESLKIDTFRCRVLKWEQNLEPNDCK